MMHKKLLLLLLFINIANGWRIYMISYGNPATINITKSVIGENYELYCPINSHESVDVSNDTCGNLNYTQSDGYVKIHFINVTFDENGKYELRVNGTRGIIFEIYAKTAIMLSNVSIKNDGGDIIGIKYTWELCFTCNNNVSIRENNGTIGILNSGSYNMTLFTIHKFMYGYNVTFIMMTLSIIPVGIYYKDMSLVYRLSFVLNFNLIEHFQTNTIRLNVMEVNANLGDALIMVCENLNDVWYFNRGISWERYSLNSVVRINNVSDENNGNYRCGRNEFTRVISLNATDYGDKSKFTTMSKLPLATNSNYLITVITIICVMAIVDTAIIVILIIIDKCYKRRGMYIVNH